MTNFFQSAPKAASSQAVEVNNSHEVTEATTTCEKDDNETLAKMFMCLCMIDRASSDLGKTHSMDLFMGVAVSVSRPVGQ